MTRSVTALLVGLRLACGSLAIAQTLAAQQPAAAAPQLKNDYASDKSWLCRPDRHDACDIDHTTTIVAANGTLRRETWKADPNAPIDCFYVYPTVSSDTSVYSDMNPDPPELGVVREQFARLASMCRPYAPLYRQVTVAGLLRALPGGDIAMDRGLGFEDVRDAWHYYLEHDNRGRGVVLISHSQGSFVLIELIRRRSTASRFNRRSCPRSCQARRSAYRRGRMWAVRSRACRSATPAIRSAARSRSPHSARTSRHPPIRSSDVCPIRQWRPRV